MSKRCVIIGASHAGSQAALSLRQSGWEGLITLIGDENMLPYHRPPLSKAYLAGDMALDQILLRPQMVYDQADITLKLGAKANKIDRAARNVTLDGGEQVPYDKLVLATGARVRPLSIPGADDPSVLYLRDARHSEAIREHIKTAKRALVIGGGYIGLEAAASLRKQGLEVVVLEAMDRILARVTSPQLSSFFRRLHKEEGVTIVEGTQALAIERARDELVIKTSMDHRFHVDCVIVGIGVIPNKDIAAEAGLQVGNGIDINAFCQTSDPDIYAIGDVAWHHCPFYDRHTRLESVPNATDQAKTVAAYMMGKNVPYKSLPWFWSDQYDVKLQIAGLFEGYDDVVVRGDMSSERSFALFYYARERLLAVDAVNAPRAFMAARMALSKGQNLDKAVVQDPEADLKNAMTAC
ncbi:MAG: FAD-dependent oxidoreductase [Pseudomonadota bacterium]